MIDAFEKDGHSQREIAKKVNRSRCAVNNYIKNKNKTPQKIPGRPEKFSQRNKRAIIRDVRKSGIYPFLKFNFLVTIMFHVGPY